MGLFVRVTSSGPDKIAVHAFASAVREWSRGAVTRTQVLAAFVLVGDDVTQIDALAATYTALATVVLKDRYLVKIHDVFLLCEAGFYTEAKARAELGF